MSKGTFSDVVAHFFFFFFFFFFLTFRSTDEDNARNVHIWQTKFDIAMFVSQLS